jgi:hypothetical protein
MSLRCPAMGTGGFVFSGMARSGNADDPWLPRTPVSACRGSGKVLCKNSKNWMNALARHGRSVGAGYWFQRCDPFAAFEMVTF